MQLFFAFHNTTFLDAFNLVFFNFKLNFPKTLFYDALSNLDMFLCSVVKPILFYLKIKSQIG
jgi:hypothetical protein